MTNWTKFKIRLGLGFIGAYVIAFCCFFPTPVKVLELIASDVPFAHDIGVDVATRMMISPLAPLFLILALLFTKEDPQK